LTRLYVTSARVKVTDEQLAQYPFSGGLFCIETDIEGMPTFAFG
jgi:sugar lactone lactonase YvrE